MSASALMLTFDRAMKRTDWAARALAAAADELLAAGEQGAWIRRVLIAAAGQVRGGCARGSCGRPRAPAYFPAYVT
jgi:hypothetical protein